MSEYGYIYCLSNPLYENIYKIGKTKNHPSIRLEQLNTTGVPRPFKLEFAKYVADFHNKETYLHDLFSTIGTRVNSQREFFELSLDTIKKVFEIIDGEYYYDKRNIEMMDISDESDFPEERIGTKRKKTRKTLSDIFKKSTMIRNKINNNTWFGKYDIENEKIYCNNNGRSYQSLSAFVTAHKKDIGIYDSSNKTNGIKECEYKTEQSTWLSVESLA